MTPVPTTTTATDANLERKKILQENTLLIQSRDTLRRETEGWQEARDAVRGELEARTGLVLSTGEYDNRLSTELRKKRDEITIDISHLEKLKDFKRNEIARLDKTTVEQKTDISKKEKAKQKLQAEIALEAAEFKKTHKVHIDEIEEASLQSQKVNKALLKARGELAKIEKEAVEKKSWIMAEEKRLGLKGRDLAIYEGRIRKAAEAVNMEITI